MIHIAETVDGQYNNTNYDSHPCMHKLQWVHHQQQLKYRLLHKESWNVHSLLFAGKQITEHTEQIQEGWKHTEREREHLERTPTRINQHYG